MRFENKDKSLKKEGLYSKIQKARYDRFIGHYLLTMNIKDSYRKVYPKCNEATVSKKAYQLMKHPYVLKKLEQKNKVMDEKMDEAQLMTRKKVLQELEAILNKTKNNPTLIKEALKSLDQISKVIGAYAPIKEEVTHKGVTINYVKPEE